MGKIGDLLYTQDSFWVINMNNKNVRGHFDKIAGKYDSYTAKRQLHYDKTKEIIFKYAKNKINVLEVGCGTGDVLAFVNPVNGYGMDISPQMVKIANKKYQRNKNLTFSTQWPKKGKYDFIFMTDVVEHLDDRLNTFKKISNLMKPGSVFVNTMMNPAWEPVEKIYTKLGLKMPEGPHARVTFNLIKQEIKSTGLKIIKHDYALLMPIHVPLLTGLINNYLEKHFKQFAFIEYFAAQKV